MRERTQTLSQPHRLTIAALLSLAAFLMAAVWANAGQIGLGDPQVNGDTVTVPVLLQADASGDVSTLDFRVRYDPSQLRPVMARPGPSAQNADKDVIGNERSPGEYSVVMMGLNRNVVSDGEVAHITFERVGQGNAADVRITQTTLASPDALEIPSRGSSRTISFDGSPQPPAQEPADRPQGTTDSAQPQTRDWPEQTQSAQAGGAQQTPAGTTAGEGGAVGGPAAPFSPDGLARQQPGGAPTGPAGTTVTAQQPAAGTPGTGTAAGAGDAQRELRGAIASADAARSGVDGPAGTAPARADGQTPAGAADPSTQAATGTDSPRTGQTVEAQVQVAQVRTTTEAGRDVQRETGGASPGATAAQPPQSSAPTLPVFIAIGVAAVAVAGLFVVRKKLFA